MAEIERIGQRMSPKDGVIVVHSDLPVAIKLPKFIDRRHVYVNMGHLGGLQRTGMQLPQEGIFAVTIQEIDPNNDSHGNYGCFAIEDILNAYRALPEIGRKEVLHVIDQQLGTDRLNIQHARDYAKDVHRDAARINASAVRAFLAMADAENIPLDAVVRANLERQLQEILV